MVTIRSYFRSLSVRNIVRKMCKIVPDTRRFAVLDPCAFDLEGSSSSAEDEVGREVAEGEDLGRIGHEEDE